ncbi:acyl-CoA dehydrogenase family protein [Bradyrhizobium roseum]|jgi:alkylation response protein AidB-like acyl-CoA dehydrogenase|uniref:acyl-CoA dehydrogenase family protein n=1 Tax=Bradyrhizobium roseum TaxID=3056648 RepID=UPI00260C7A93|nr:acyl-CoA dehydrogenase family protein [Bradyrhizobium roseus]WKA27455.1 acyl-CoA dehydrogenase family protein [Bradyrhizobium roseus]
MAIDFTMSAEQRKIQKMARDFSEGVLAPVIPAADKEPDPMLAYQKTKGAYIEAYKAGIAMAMLPKEYGGGGLSCLDFVIAAEEICAVDPGFACTVLCNGLGLMPVSWYGSEEQKKRFIGAATSDPTGTYLSAWTAGEPPGGTGGTANFDSPLPKAGIGMTAVRDGDHFILNGKKKWSSSAGWDGLGTNTQCAIIRTDTNVGGTEGLSAIIIERGTPGITWTFLDKEGHRTTSNAFIVFKDARVPVDNLLPGAKGNGDFVINRNFAWSGPVAAIAAVGVARSAYEDALKFLKTNTAGSLTPIIRFQNAGYIMGDVAAKIESARYFSWRAADYLDKHSQHAELIGAMCKINVTEAMVDCVYKCMQVVGVNSLSTEFKFGKYLREAAVLPIYDGGNMGMQRRRVHGIIAEESFNPRAIMDDDFVKFEKSMEAIGTVADPVAKSRGIMQAAE